jgi:hypothetical protein
MKDLVKVMALLVLVGTGCGDKSPAEKCKDLISSVCDRAVDCISGASGMQDDCVRAVESGFSCSDTKSVGPGYDSCMDTLDELSCSTLFPIDPGTGELTVHLPDTCIGVLSTQSVGGERTPVQRSSTRPDDRFRALASQARATLE